MIMFGYCLRVKCVCFHKMGFVKGISKRAGDNTVLMSPCLIWELEMERSFLCFDLFNHNVNAVHMHMS